MCIYSCKCAGNVPKVPPSIINTVEPRYYVPRLQRFHPYNVQIPKSRISVMHYICYRYRLQRTPLQRNFRYNVQISSKNMKNGLRYNVQRGSISAVKRAKLPANMSLMLWHAVDSLRWKGTSPLHVILPRVWQDATKTKIDFAVW